MAWRRSGLAASPMRSDFISIASTVATAPSRSPMMTVPTPSQVALPVSCDSVIATRATTSPQSAAESSSSTTGTSGDFDSRM